MNTIRIMTYQVDGCCGGDGQTDVGRILEVIAEAAPDIVALQGVDAREDNGQLTYLARQLGMTWHANRRNNANAFLSYYPLSAIQEFDLGGAGCCLRADTNINGKRIHLFNVAISKTPGRRLEQINRLLGPDLLGHPRLACPTLIFGDFGDLLWGVGNLNLALTLKKVRRPLWGTYPASFPVFARDRAYLRGELRVVESSVLHSATARRASRHLPLTLTVQIIDPRNYLRSDALAPKHMEIAPG